MKTFIKSRIEWISVLVLVALLFGMGFLDPVPQSQNYHHFIDTRALDLGGIFIPNASDVLSNLAFVLVGMAGIALIARFDPLQQHALGLFFVGLILTGMGSAAYHWAPNDQTLVWDRLPMMLAFSGVLGAIATERLGREPGLHWMLSWIYLGSLSIALWLIGDDLRLWIIVQLGGVMLIALWLINPPAKGRDRPLPWQWLIVAYVLAKGFELNDEAIWRMTDGVVSGHALKHIVAAAGLIPVLVFAAIEPVRTKP